MKAWILYDSRLGIDLPFCDSLPIYFDNLEDAIDTKDSEHQEIQEVIILTDSELDEERRKAFGAGQHSIGCCEGERTTTITAFQDYLQSLKQGEK